MRYGRFYFQYVKCNKTLYKNIRRRRRRRRKQNKINKKKIIINSTRNFPYFTWARRSRRKYEVIWSQPSIQYLHYLHIVHMYIYLHIPTYAVYTVQSDNSELNSISLLSRILQSRRASKYIFLHDWSTVWRQALSQCIHSLIMICLDITGNE